MHSPAVAGPKMAGRSAVMAWPDRIENALRSDWFSDCDERYAREFDTGPCAELGFTMDQVVKDHELCSLEAEFYWAVAGGFPGEAKRVYNSLKDRADSQGATRT